MIKVFIYILKQTRNFILYSFGGLIIFSIIASGVQFFSDKQLTENIVELYKCNFINKVSFNLIVLFVGCLILVAIIVRKLCKYTPLLSNEHKKSYPTRISVYYLNYLMQILTWFGAMVLAYIILNLTVYCGFDIAGISSEESGNYLFWGAIIFIHILAEYIGLNFAKSALEDWEDFKLNTLLLAKSYK